MEEKRDYGVTEDEMGFKKESLTDYKEDYSLSKNPINSIISNFSKIFMMNEALARENFVQLNEFVEKFNKDINENYFYDNMEIVNQMKIILQKYRIVTLIERQTISLCHNKIIEISEVVQKNYVLQKELEDLKDEIQLMYQKEIMKKNG